MSRILVAHGDAASRESIRGELTRRGHEVTDVETAKEAGVWAMVGGLDLIIADAVLADARGPQLQRVINQRIVPPFPPFLFLAAEGERAGIDDAHIVPKPIDVAALADSVEAVIAEIRREEGGFRDDSLDQLLAKVAGNGESGTLEAFRDATVKKVVFLGGEVALCASNNPREWIGQAFIKAGLISEEDLSEAMEIHEHSRQPLGKILQALNKVTLEQAEETVTKKFREGLLELYLWRDGHWIYRGGQAAESPHGRVRIDLAGVRREGAERASRWRQLRQILPGGRTKFAVVRSAFPEGFPSTPVQTKLLQFAEQGLSLGQICLELRHQDYAVYTAFAKFVQLGVVSVLEGGAPVSAPPTEQAESAEIPDGPAAVRSILAAARAAIERGELEQAREVFRDVLRLDQTNADARRGLAQIQVALQTGAEQEGISADKTVELAIPVEALMSEPLSPSEAFVLTRLVGGEVRVSDLLAICPLPEAELLDVLRRHLSAGRISIKQ